MMNLPTESMTVMLHVGGKPRSGTMSYSIHYLSIMQPPIWTFYDIFSPAEVTEMFL